MTSHDASADGWTLAEKYATVHEALRSIWVSATGSYNMTVETLGARAREVLDRVDGKPTTDGAETVCYEPGCQCSCHKPRISPSNGPAP